MREFFKHSLSLRFTQTLRNHLLCRLCCDSTSFVYTLLDGWNCDWNYGGACPSDRPCEAGYPGVNPACRKDYVADGGNGAPSCANGTSSASQLAA